MNARCWRSAHMLLGAAMALGCTHGGSHAVTTSVTTADPAAAPVAGRANPFFTASPLLNQAPPFDRIRDSDYQPAIEEGMRQQLAEIEAIANQTAEPTFENTISAMERSGVLLTRVRSVFSGVRQANSNDALQRVQAEEAPKLAAHSDAIHLNPKLYARVKRLYDDMRAVHERPPQGLIPEQAFLVERYHRDFVRAGAELNEADKTKLRALNQEEATHVAEFQAKLLAATKAGAVVVETQAQLDGLSDGDIAAAADAAKQRGLTGKWVIPLQNTSSHIASREPRRDAM